jgi:tetratricopeptide (TPR) repeat protein
LAGALVSLFLLSGCQTPPQTQALLSAPLNINKQHIIESVPFYPQQDYYCGPTTLSEVANYYGNDWRQDDIAPLTFVPGLEGSLQIEMVSATRRLGMVAYVKQGNLDLLLSLVANNIPIIVLQNNSISWLPQWHYAVVIGYDLTTQELILHSGITANHRLNFATFERTWRRGQYWMLAMLPPSKTDPLLNPFVYAKACQDLLETGQSEAGITALKSAIKQWPEYWLPYFLLANHYLADNPRLAVNWFEKGYQVGLEEAVYLNNYAYALMQLHCFAQANKIIERALMLAPDDSNIIDTQNQIQSASEHFKQQDCR